MDSKTKIALVTGGSRGLGKDMALRLAEQGTDVILTYKAKQADAQSVVAQIQKLGRKAIALPLDTGNVKSFDAFVASLQDTLKKTFNTDKFDFLVNNAGVGYHALVTETTEEAFDELVNIHFKGVYFLTQKTLPHIVDGGRIVNISSGLARFSMPGMSAYGSLKGAVETLTRYMAKELGSRGINVNVVAPGAIATDFSGGLVRDNENVNKMVASVTALGRVGQADDIGGVVAFLCSPEAKWINGQRIEASGGMNL